MRAAPPVPRLFVLLVILLVGILGAIKPVEGLCMCAERFASSSDFTNNTSSPFFDNFKDGQTIVFRNAAFHCNTVLTTVTFNGQTKNCGDVHCTSNAINAEESQPMLQLWRMNSTIYYMVEFITLTAQDINTNIDVEWSVERDDVLGIWVPSSCQCSTNLLKIGYLYGMGGSRVYRIDGDVINSFDPTEYILQDGPLPMISVETDENYNAACIIGLPAGALVALIALCFTCVGVCWSISLHNKKTRTSKGAFDISVPIHDQQVNGTEMNQVSSTPVDNSYEDNIPSDQRYNSLGRPIYTMPLPAVPTNIDDTIDSRSMSYSPQLSYTDQTSTHNAMPHSTSNPDLSASTHSYGNVDHRRSLTRASAMYYNTQPNSKPPVAVPRQIPMPQYPTVMTSQPTSIVSLDANNTLPSSPGLNSVTESKIDMVAETAEQSYDRDSEYEIPDDQSSEIGEVEDEYINIQGLQIDSIDSSGSNDVYY